jgi:hypothetical protein
MLDSEMVSIERRLGDFKDNGKGGGQKSHSKNRARAEESKMLQIPPMREYVTQ